MNDLFTKIINNEIPAFKIYQDELVTAFLDVHPINKGHALVVPNQKVLKLQELDELTYLHLMKVVRIISLKVETVFQPPRVAIVVEGFEIPHAHVHIFPAFESADLHKTTDQKLSLNPDEMTDIQQKLTINSL